MNTTATATATANRAPVIYTDERLVIALAMRPERALGFYADALDTTPNRIRAGLQSIKLAGYVKPVHSNLQITGYELSESGEALLTNAREGNSPEASHDYAIVLLGVRHADSIERSVIVMESADSIESLKNALEIAHRRIDTLTTDLYEAQQRELIISIEREKALNANRTHEADKAGLRLALNEKTEALNTCINEKHVLFARAERAEVALEDKQEALDRKQKELSKYMEKNPREEAQRSKDLNAIIDTVKMMLNSVIESKVSHGEKNATMRELVRMMHIQQDNANAYQLPF